MNNIYKKWQEFESEDMAPEYDFDFSKAVHNDFSKRIKKEGTITRIMDGDKVVEIIDNLTPYGRKMHKSRNPAK